MSNKKSDYPCDWLEKCFTRLTIIKYNPVFLNEPILNLPCYELRNEFEKCPSYSVMENLSKLEKLTQELSEQVSYLSEKVK